MGSLQKINGLYYIVQKVRCKGGWKNKYRRASEAEVTAFQNAELIKSGDLTFITCAYPKCDGQIAIPRHEKQFKNTTQILRYGRISFHYCSKNCQELHNKDLKSIMKDNKNEL